MKTLLAAFILVALSGPAVSSLQKVLNRQTDFGLLLAEEAGGEDTGSEVSYAYNVQGHDLIRQGKIEEAAEKFRQAINAEPSAPDGYRNLGWCLYKLGQYKESKLTYEKALKVAPEHPMSGWSYGALGQNCIHLEEYEDARDALEEAVARMPDLNWAYDNLGVAYHHLGEYEKACWAYRKALELDPKSSWTYYNLGVSCADLGISDKAIINFQKAILFGVPHRSKAYHRMIVEYQKMGDPENAWRAYRELEAVDPEEAARLQSVMEPESLSHPSAESSPNY